MPAYRLFDKLQTFYGDAGQALPGGYLKFYVAATTTPQSVYGERALSTNNGSQVALTSSSRLAHECWADTTLAYFVELYNASNVKQGEISYVEIPGGQGQTIPVPNEGEFLTGDGTNFLAEEIRQVPDPTGNAGKILGTDGTLIQWVVKPTDGEAGESDVEDAANYFRIGNIMVQWGTGSAAASGTDTTSATVTYSPAFGATPLYFDASVTVASVNGVSLVADSYTAASASGCTVNFNNADRHYEGSSKLTSAIPFTWVAIGEAP